MGLQGDILSIGERLDADATLTGKGVCIAFVDSGFFPHADLMWPTPRIRMYAAVTREKPSSLEFLVAQPRSWHGTMTACCAAGSGTSSHGRYRGLASDAAVVLIQAADDNGGLSGKHVATAIRFPLRHPELGIRIVNVSVGVNDDDPDASDVLSAVAEVVAAGIPVIAAAGNDPTNPPEAPGSSPHVITVGGANDNNTREVEDDAPWPSSFGARIAGVSKPDLLAPAFWLAAPMLPGTRTSREAAALFDLRAVLGESLVEQAISESREDSADIAALLDLVTRRIDYGRYISRHEQHVEGTSFAAPITASVVAQMLEVDPSLTPADIRTALTTTARRLPKVPRSIQGAGVLNARAATEWVRHRVATREAKPSTPDR